MVRRHSFQQWTLYTYGAYSVICVESQQPIHTNSCARHTMTHRHTDIAHGHWRTPVNKRTTEENEEEDDGDDDEDERTTEYKKKIVFQTCLTSLSIYYTLHSIHKVVVCRLCRLYIHQERETYSKNCACSNRTRVEAVPCDSIYFFSIWKSQCMPCTMYTSAHILTYAPIVYLCSMLCAGRKRNSGRNSWRDHDLSTEPTEEEKNPNSTEMNFQFLFFWRNRDE